MEEDKARFSNRIVDLKLYKLFTPEAKRKISENNPILCSIEDFNPLEEENNNQSRLGRCRKLTELQQNGDKLRRRAIETIL
jgi:hypothetical protein